MADNPLSPTPIANLLADAKLQPMRDAIVATFAGLMPGMLVEAHPGKLDVSDILKADLKSTPCILVGWTRLRAEAEAASHYNETVDFVAYIVVNEWVDLEAKRRVPREEVGQAIGNFLLRILHNDHHDTFGLRGVTQPLRSPAPEFKPVFTATSYAKGVAYYAVTWSQTMIDLGQSIATDPDFTFGALPAAIDDGITLGDGADPEADAIQALFAEAEALP